MNVVVFLSQAVATMALSLGGWWLLGAQIYVGIGILLAVASVVLMLSASTHMRSEMHVRSVGPSFEWIFVTVLIGAFAGVFWPAFPIVFAYGAARERVHDRAHKERDVRRP